MAASPTATYRAAPPCAVRHTSVAGHTHSASTAERATVRQLPLECRFRSRRVISETRRLLQERWPARLRRLASETAEGKRRLEGWNPGLDPGPRGALRGFSEPALPGQRSLGLPRIAPSSR